MPLAVWMVVPMLVGAGHAMGTTYYVAATGDDTAAGTSPETAWQTLGRVNSQALEPGDQVRFHRGDTWRGQLRPRRGAEDQPILYSAYGDGPKPLLLGSIAKDRPEDWLDEGGGIWSTVPPRPVGPELLPQGGWSLYCEDGAQARLTTANGELRVEIGRTGESGSDIQLILVGLRIEEGRTYGFSLQAESSEERVLEPPSLMSRNAPWTSYSDEPRHTFQVRPEPVRVEHYYHATVTSDDARMTLYLGGRLPDGTVLTLSGLSLREAEGEPLPADVGNIILDGGPLCGVKVWHEADLDAPSKYWYDQGRRLVKLVSPTNPAVAHTSVELAIRQHIIDESGVSWATFEQLDLRYGAAHGVGGGNTSHIIVRDCDLSFIGGGHQFTTADGRPVRFGNGIEFWGRAEHNLVERCRLWEIYDAALTNQSMGADVVQADITYRNNLVWNSEYSFEYWNRPETSVTRDIRFEHNTCVNAGHGWAHAQRPDPSGRHLCFYASPAAANGIRIQNNVFYEATSNAFYAPQWPAEAVAALELDHNCWYQAEGVMLNLLGSPYTMAQFADYQAQRGKGAHSFVGDPLLVDIAGGDLRLRPGSPCLDAGLDLGVTDDYAGSPRPQGRAPDIGAYESAP